MNDLLKYKEFAATLEKMNEKEIAIATVMYLKDIKDMLQSLLEDQSIDFKHY
jgi:transcription initiation factor IIE alpha subunit